MKLSFVIPAYNEENVLGQCLDSVIEQSRKYPGLVEIVVVNNASTDRTKSIARAYGGVRTVDEPRKGIVWARRAGFLAAQGELIANIDADTMLTPGWLRTVFDEFSGHPNLVALSGPFTYYDLSWPPRLFVRIFYYLVFLLYLINRFVLGVGSMLQGGNFIVKRTALEAIGGYDTTIEFYGEDADLARRLHRVGPVKWTFRLPMFASGRRLAREGLLTIGTRYALNYFWVLFRKHPLHKTSLDIRPTRTPKSTRYRNR